jgi:hypothetical protein
MDTYCAINRAKWVIPWNGGVLQFKKGSRLPFFALDGWKDGRMTRWTMGRMDDEMDDGTNGWKGWPPKDDKTSDIIYID